MTWPQRLSCLLLVTASAGSGLFFWDAHKLLTGSALAVYNVSVAAYNANGAVGTLNDTLAALNAPCKDFQGDYICGPIPQLAQTEKNIGILAAKSAQQVQQSAVLVNASAIAVQRTADAASGLLASARTTTDALPPLVGDVRTAVEGLPPVEDQATAALVNFNRILASKDVSEGLHGFAVTADNAGGITGDFRARFHEILYPPPCQTFGCKMEKVVWPAIKDLPVFGESLYWTKALVTNQKP
jgi:hypothetical protein